MNDQAQENSGYGDLSQEINLHSYVEKVTDQLQEQVLATYATVYNYVNPLRYIDANPESVERIIHNLLDNALRYRHPERHPFIEISSLTVGNETMLSIKDNGLGIDLETHRMNLYGMPGLLSVKSHVDSMGCYIGVESQVGAGTEFRVYFKTSVAE